MIRRQLLRKNVGSGGYFRWRGGDVSRIEGLSDAVFGFAITLLVVSLEVPRSYTALIAAMRGYPAFAVCFAFLLYIWYQHYIFFRRYGLDDLVTLVLNGILLFVVLFFIYPLKFLFSLLLAPDPATAAGGGMTAAQAVSLMTVYGSGFVAVFVVFALLDLHAYRKREHLQLNAAERFLTRSAVAGHLGYVAIGGISILLANTLPPRYVAWAGWSYALLGAVGAVHGTLTGMWLDKYLEPCDPEQPEA